jgi:hypothetical protein
MNRPVFILLAVAVLFPATGAAGAAPVPDEEKAARKELERLKERLPEVLTGWVKKRWWGSGYQAKLRVIRQTGPGEARVWILLEDTDDPTRDEALTLYLRYYRGAWFTTRFEGTWQSDDPWKGNKDRAARFLMMAVDEAGGK